MIVARAREIQGLLTTLNRRESDASAAADIRDTLQELRDLQTLLDKARMTHGRIAGRLAPDDNERICDQFRAMLNNVRVSRSDFEGQTRQAQRLRTMRTSADSLVQQLDAAWGIYADGVVYPHAELLVLVQSLPEMQLRLSRLVELHEQLQAQTQVAPTSDAHLQAFDLGVTQLADELGDIQGLTTGVQTFLRDVALGTATIAMLTDEALAWCRQGERANVFQIRFSSNRANS